MKKINRFVAVLAIALLLNSGNAFGQVVLVPIDPPDKKQAVLEFLDEYPELAAKFYDFISVLKSVENLYVDKKSKEELISIAMKGMVNGLDSYSYLLVDKEASDVLRALRSEEKYVGVGISMMKLGRDIIITSVFKNSPARKRGLEPGDIILKVNGQDISNSGFLEVRNLIRGEKNTTVSIEVRSKRFQKPRVFLLTRADVVYASIDTTNLSEYGYVKINQFVEETPERVRGALKSFQNKKALIIDLRDNPGGLVRSVNEIAGLFIGSDKTTIVMKGRNQQFNRELRTNSRKEKYPSKIVVLVNNFSASASEILAGTLQYYKIAKIIGVRTFGKAVGQSVMDLANDDAGDVRLLLTLTTFRYYFPDGKSVSDSGIAPDIEVEQPDGFRVYEYGTKKDRQLQKAIEFLKR